MENLFHVATGKFHLVEESQGFMVVALAVFTENIVKGAFDTCAERRMATNINVGAVVADEFSHISAARLELVLNESGLDFIETVSRMILDRRDGGKFVRIKGVVFVATTKE